MVALIILTHNRPAFVSKLSAGSVSIALGSIVYRAKLQLPAGDNRNAAISRPLRTNRVSPARTG